MKNKLKSVKQGSRSAAASQSKTHGADGAAAQTPEDLLKLVRSHATWSITSDTMKALHRTLDGQLILADRKPADMSGHIEYTGARPVSYAEACKWIPTSGNHWKPEVLLHFHGIIDPARAAMAEQSKPGQSNAVDKTSQLAGFGGDPAELVPPSAGEVGVVIYDYDRDENVAEFNLTAAEFARIRDAIAKTVDRPVDREAVTNFVRESLLRSANRELLPGYSPTNLVDAHDRLGLAVSAAMAAISVLSDAYFEAIDSDNEYQIKGANGLINLAHHASCQLETECELAWHEWVNARKAAQ